MRLIPLPDPAAVATHATDALRDVIEARRDARILLPAGGTPIPFYDEVRRRVRSGALDVRDAHFFQLDELVGVPPSDERSFHKFLREHVLDHVPRDPDRDHLLHGDAADPRREIERHGARLDALGGADLVLLGLGPNGHVAYNEPGSSTEDGSRVVELQAPTLAGLAEAFGDAHPRLGMTLGLRDMLAGATIVLLVTGAGKRDALHRLRDHPATSDFPASLLAGHPSFTILADREATGD